VKYLSVISALVTLNAVSSRAASVAGKAESGPPGADFVVSNSTGLQCFAIATNGAGSNSSNFQCLQGK
jgi:hypothetical protein